MPVVIERTLEGGRELLRVGPTRGVAPAGVDRENRIVRGAHIIRKGVLKDGRFEVDDVMLEQVIEKSRRFTKGLKARYDHPQASESSMGTELGRWHNLRRDGDRVIGDLHLLAAADTSPKGELAAHTLDLAEEAPDQFGVSIVFTRDKYVYRIEPDGEPKKGPDGKELPPLGRIKTMHAADVVDEPATGDSFLSSTPSTAAGAFLDWYVNGADPDSPPNANVLPGVSAEQAAGFVDRFLRSRGLAIGPLPHDHMEVNAMAKEKKAGAAAPDDRVQTDAEAHQEASAAEENVTTLAVQTTAPSPTNGTASARGVSDDEIKQIAAARAAEVLDIQAIGRQLGCAELADRLIQEGCDLASASRAMLKHHAEQPEHQPLAGVIAGQAAHLSIGADQADKLFSASLDALSLRAGIEDDVPERRQSEVRELRGMSLLEVGRLYLRKAGLRPSGDRMADAQAMLNMGGRNAGPVMLAAFGASTSDFPYLLANVANKSMLRGFEQQATTWDRWARRGSVSDFKTFSRVKLSESDDLVLTPEGGEFQDSTIDEGREQGQAVTYGRLFSTTRQAIVNDDLDQITRQPERFGMAAARLPDNLLYADLLSHAMGPVMGSGARLFVDGTNWFDNADVSGFDSTLDLDNGQAAINHAQLLMSKRTNLKGLQDLMIDARYCLVPPELIMYARILFVSASNVTDEKNAGVINPWQGFVEVIKVPHLSKTALYTGASTTAWYLVAGPEVDTYEVFFLDGVAQPTLEEQEGFKIDGRTYKVRMDVGVKALNDVGFVKSKGAA